MAGIYEVDYSVKDKEAWATAPKDVPAYVVADSVQDAVKEAAQFEDANLTLIKCNVLYHGKVALPKKFKGVAPSKGTE